MLTELSGSSRASRTYNRCMMRREATSRSHSAHVCLMTVSRYVLFGPLNFRVSILSRHPQYSRIDRSHLWYFHIKLLNASYPGFMSPVPCFVVISGWASGWLIDPHYTPHTGSSRYVAIIEGERIQLAYGTLGKDSHYIDWAGNWFVLSKHSDGACGANHSSYI